MIVFQHDFMFFQFGRKDDPHLTVCLIGNVSGNNPEAPIELTSFRQLFETFGVVDKPTWRAVHKALDHVNHVLLFDRTDHVQALFDIAEGDSEVAPMLRDCIQYARLNVKAVRAYCNMIDNHLIGEAKLTIDHDNLRFEYPYVPAKSQPEGKPRKQHGPQSRKQWWNR